MADELTDRISRLAKTLNGVKSNAQARAAVKVALAELDRGKGLISDLPGGVVGFFGALIREDNVGLTESQATNEIKVRENEINRLAAELAKDDRAAVSAYNWARLRPAIEQAYYTVGGIEGATGQIGTFDPVANMGRAISEAPGVFTQGARDLAVKAGDEAKKTITTAGIVGGKVLEGLKDGAKEALRPVAPLLFGLSFVVIIVLVVAGFVVFKYGRRLGLPIGGK